MASSTPEKDNKIDGTPDCVASKPTYAATRESIPTIMTSLGSIFRQFCDENDSSVTNDMLTEESFVGQSVPDMTMADYLSRLYKYFRSSPSCFVVAVIYIDRFVSCEDPGVPLIHSLNVHRIFCTALVLASKFLEDKVYSNKFYAEVGGFPMDELAKFEITFISLLGFDLAVNKDTFVRYYEQLANPPKPACSIPDKECASIMVPITEEKIVEKISNSAGQKAMFKDATVSLEHLVLSAASSA